MYISFVIPVYNVEKYIKKCIDSITCHKEDIEIICIDDASTDRSSEILDELSITDKRIIIIHNTENKGLSYVRNQGIKLSRGEYIWFVDGDDSIANDCDVKGLYEYSHNNNIDVLAIGYECVYETDELKTEYGFTDERVKTDWGKKIVDGSTYFSGMVLADKFECCVPFNLFSRTWLIENDLTFSPIKFEDNLFMPIALFKAKSVSYVEKKLYVYNRRIGSITTSNLKILERVPTMMYVIENLIDFSKTVNIDEQAFKAIEKYIDNLICIAILDFLDALKQGLQISFFNVRHKMMFYMFLSQYYKYISHEITYENIKKILNAKKIIVYGAGKVSISVQRLLMDLGVKEFCVAVTDNMGGNVNRIDELRWSASDSLVLISVGKEKQREMDEYADELGFSNRLFVT